MRWRDLRRSQNVRDVRGRGGGFGRGGVKLGIGGLIMLAAAYLLGVDPRLVMGLLDAGGSVTQTPATTGAPDDDAGNFASAILGSTEDVWSQLFREAGAQYPPPVLILYSEMERSGCGVASAAAGPFYCPPDQGVYVDLNFFQQLAGQFGGPQDAARDDSFAKAYVIAHEVGHHVQTVLGLSERIRAEQARASQEVQNALQVRMELQADCLAGVWAHYTHDRLEEKDIRDALAAAAAVGDDMIQKKMQGYVVPESFTHGSAEQRQRWFARGFENGQIAACDTFGAASL